MRNRAPPIGRPRRYNTTVDEQAAERELGFVGHIKHSLSIASRGAIWLAAFPKTARYCHLVPFWNRRTATLVTTVLYVASRVHAERA